MCVGELDLFEVIWLRAHGDELIGLTDDEAAAVVRSAGFHPTIFRPGIATAYAGTGGEGKVLLVAVDGRVRLARPA